MRILLVSDAYPPERIGGIGYIVESLRSELLKKGCEVTVLTSGVKTKELQKNKIIKSNPSLLKASLINNFIILKWIFQKKFDLINIHQSTSCIFLIILPLIKLFRFKVPVIVNSLQVDYVQEYKMVKNLKINNKIIKPVSAELKEKYLKYPLHIVIDLIGYYFSNAITVVSKQNEREINKNYGFLFNKPISLIPNGIDVDRFPYKENKLNSDEINLIYVGSFRVRKRIFHMIELIHLLVTKYKINAKLHLVGAGRKGYDERIQALIKTYELENNIILHGKVLNEELPKYLSLAQVFILISSYEGLSVALLEALGSGKVVLSSDLYGSADVIEHRKNGLLVELDNLEQAAGEIEFLVKNPEQLIGISSEGQNLIKEYSWNKIGLQYYELFNKLLNK